MLSNRFAYAALAAGCLTAAAAGGYIAVRQTTAPATPQAQATPASSPAQAAQTETKPVEVQETEAVVGDSKPAPAVVPTPDQAPPPATAAPVAPSGAKHGDVARPAPQQARSQHDAAAGPQAAGAARAPRSAGASPVASAPAVPDPVPQPSTLPDPGSSPLRADAADAARTPDPAEPQRTYDELVVPADSVIGLQMETPVSSERARVEDRVDARVTRDVRVSGKVAVPAGTHALGSVTLVERGGKFKEKARLGVRFHTLVLADGTRLPISTDTVYREGEAPGNEASKKIGGAAVGGAILGAILGGARGAAIGATAGAGAGSAVVAAGDRNAATLTPGTPMTVRLLSPVTVSVEEK